MEMHQIRYFLAVAEALNFTRAAEECHVAQPSLSRAIGKLEDELGGALFRRERNHTHLTDLGRRMQPLLQQAYDGAVKAKEQAAKYRSSEYAPLRIGLSKTIAMALLLPALRELERAFPGLELHVFRGDSGAVFEALKAGDIELAIATEIAGADWDRLDQWHLFEEGFVVTGSPELVETGLTPDDIGGLSFILRPYCENRADVEAALSAGGVTAQYRHEVSGDDDVDTLVGGGMGLALLPESSAQVSGFPAVAIDGMDVTRKVEAYGVFGRQRSTAASSLVNLLRAADWSGEAA